MEEIIVTSYTDKATGIMIELVRGAPIVIEVK
jgi:hypothetical protein